MIKLEDVKLSLRLDEDWDDGLLQNYIDTAQEYVISAVDHNISVDEISKYKQFDFAVSLLAQYWYNTRNVDVDKPVPTEVLAMIQQLRGKMKDETLSK